MQFDLIKHMQKCFLLYAEMFLIKHMQKCFLLYAETYAEMFPCFIKMYTLLVRKLKIPHKFTREEGKQCEKFQIFSWREKLATK